MSAMKRIDSNELSKLLLNYSKEPDPIQNYQNWGTGFDINRKYEISEQDREMRRQRLLRSKDSFFEVLIVVGVLAMIFIPFLVWLYYKSGVCDCVTSEERQRRHSHGLSSEDSDTHHQKRMPEPHSVTSDSMKSVKQSLKDTGDIRQPFFKSNSVGSPYKVVETASPGRSIKKKTTHRTRSLNETAMHGPSRV